MIITKVNDSSEHKGKHELTFEDGRQIIVSADVLTQFYLYPGKDLSEETLEEIKQTFSRDEVRRIALKIIDRRAMSRKELVDKLLKKDQDRDAAQEAADWLEEIGLLDDEDYASLVVRHYSEKGYGKMRIQQELYRRGIDRELWDAALMEMPQDTDALDKFIQAKLRGELPDRKEEKRVTDALFRRGYTWDEIRSGMRRYKESLEE